MGATRGTEEAVTWRDRMLLQWLAIAAGFGLAYLVMEWL